jgi:hypothetical protein
MTTQKRFIPTLWKLVLGIIIIQALLVIVALLLSVRGHPHHHHLAMTRAKIADIESAVKVYALEHLGKLPDSLDDLRLKPNDFLDAWGEPIRYERDGTTFTLTSSGPDGEMGTADDLTN